MRKFALIFGLCFILLGCEDKKVKDYGKQVIFTEQCDTSTVWRVKLHPLRRHFDRDYGIIAIALADGKRFSVKYHASEDATKDWMLLNEGDTVVYQGDKIVSVIWREQ